MTISDRIGGRVKRKATTQEAPVTPSYGKAGAPIDRGHPFYFGFIATTGALSAFVLMRALASASQVLFSFLSLSSWQLVLIQRLKLFVDAGHRAQLQWPSSLLRFWR